MSLSDLLKSLPMVHHFYPINPETALQQQSAVYNTLDHPIVAPIPPAPPQPFRDIPPNSNKRRKIQEVNSEVQYLGSTPSGSLSQRRKKSKHRHAEPLQKPSESLTICLGPRHQRRIAYVEIPDHRYMDLTLYRPISLASPASQLLLGLGRRHNRARSVSQTSFGESPFSSSPDPSTGSEYLDPEVSISVGGKQKGSRGTNPESNTKAKNLEVPEDEATTCHQCRRKTTKEKMRCRRLRPDGSVCPYLFCQSCIDVRYDEIFDAFHSTWHCPRCRGICNCSICLRKAGFGYILDGPMSEQFTGTQGRLSVAGRSKKYSRGGRVKQGNQRDEGQPQVSVRAWLARKGIGLGTEEWMMERRRQGVRYVVGKSPPPPDVPSPYVEAQFNPTIVACTDCMEDDDIDDPSDEKPPCEGDADTATSSGPVTLIHNDVTAMSRTQEMMDSNREPLQSELQPNTSTLNDMTAAETHEETGLHMLPLPLPDADAPACAAPSEDLPGLCSVLTSGLRLIVGKPLHKSTGKKKNQLNMPKIKKRKVNNSKRQVEADVSDYEYDATTQQKVGPPVIWVGDYDPPDSGSQIKIFRDYGKEEGKDNKGSSPILGVYHSSHADEISTPPPAEPVLVPTEYYAPSKLDATMSKGSQGQFGHTYWSFNAVTPREHGHEHHSGHGPGSSSLLMSTPLYSNNDGHPYPQISMGDMCPVGPSATESTSASTSRHDPHYSSSGSTSLSNSRTPDDYMNSQDRRYGRDVDAYTTHGLAAFTALDEPWASVGMDLYPNLEIDMSPLQVEGIAQAVDVASHQRTSDQP